MTVTETTSHTHMLSCGDDMRSEPQPIFSKWRCEDCGTENNQRVDARAPGVRMERPFGNLIDMTCKACGKTTVVHPITSGLTAL